jgi:membrane-bound lytic murein transglycosylase B
MQRRRLLLATAAIALAPPARSQGAADALNAAPTRAPLSVPYPQREDVRAFIDEVVDATGLERGWIERVLAQGRYSEPAERLTTPSLAPPSARDWRDYRARNVDERRVRDGGAFLRQHRNTLARVHERFGVPEHVVVSIIGIETVFGRVMGNFRTLDVLLTLSFDYTRRAALYREELTQFLLLCREMNLDPLTVRGSFAGALGMPQFMPSSIRKFAVDFDGKGRVDLVNSPQDAMGSVGSFLAAHGWERGLPVQFAAQADAGVVELLGRGIRAQYRWQDVAALGVKIRGELDPETRVLLLDLPLIMPSGAEAVEYRIGTVNMSALLHYNRSYFYGSAVADLAETILARSVV